MLLDARTLIFIPAVRDPSLTCPYPRPYRCDAASYWGGPARWHSTPHRGCFLR